ARMDAPHSDALVFFGATGDLAYKKIFPALYAMTRRGVLDAPVIGVALPGWTVEQLRARARESIERHGGGIDEAGVAKLRARRGRENARRPGVWKRSVGGWGASSGRPTPSRPRRASSRPSSTGSRRRDAPRARGWSSRSRSAATSRRRSRSTRRCTGYSRSRRS